MKMSEYNALVQGAIKYNNLGLLKAAEALVNDFPHVPDNLIEDATINARGMYKNYLHGELMHLLGTSDEYKELEKRLYAVVKEIGTLQIEFAKMHNLGAAQSNGVLEDLTRHLTTNLFNLTPLTKSW
jgi:hypothetical protein